MTPSSVAVPCDLPSPPPSAVKHSSEDYIFNEDRGSGTSASSHDSRTSSPSTFHEPSSISGKEQEAHQADENIELLSPPASVKEEGDASRTKAARPAYLYMDDGSHLPPPEEPCDDIAGVPVFTPSWHDFRDFYTYSQSIDEWGMRSGIVKIIPPKEWTDALPPLDGRENAQKTSAGSRYTNDNRLSQVRIKNSIEQIFTPGGLGVWRQSNVVHPARIVNAKQWADTCASADQRGPDMQRMKANAERKGDSEEDGVRTRSGRGSGAPLRPSVSKIGSSKNKKGSTVESAAEQDDSQPSSKSSTKPKMAERTTQEEWDAFDYRNDWAKEAGDASPDDWTPRVCREIEREYWRGLNYGKPPMYGADLAGTLFTPETSHWNVGTLDNILTRLRLKRKLPGVTTPYLYFGMWRATFAWHVEDMDLYSINYIHFGAPKQWYSIRQADKQAFELAMSAAFPADSGRCRHFMRHKSYLASPTFLGSAANRVKPLRLVQKAQEFVITYPYGYHSGYNLGYNCAESVNFALERWLDIGRKAGYCDCTNDSVKMDVDAMLEESKELEEMERKRMERERRREEDQNMDEAQLQARRLQDKQRRLESKRIHEADGSEYAEKKKKVNNPCIFCPSLSEEDLVPIFSDGSKGPRRRAHRLCASFLPETWVAPITNGNSRPKDAVMGVEGIPKARWALKCQLCSDPAMQKFGAKVQCTFGKCSRTTHVSCALEEQSGWLLDVTNDEEADILESRVKPSKDIPMTSTETNDEKMDSNDDTPPRLVILCRSHNPDERQKEARRKAEIMRASLNRLTVGQRVSVKIAGGSWETEVKDIFVCYGPLPAEPSHEDEGYIVVEEDISVNASRILFAPEVSVAAENEVQSQETEREERNAREAVQMEADRQARKEAKEIEKRERKALQEQRKIEREAKKVEREQKRAEKEAKKARQQEIRLQREAQRAAQPSFGTPMQKETHPPSTDTFQYIRDWRPRFPTFPVDRQHHPLPVGRTGFSAHPYSYHPYQPMLEPRDPMPVPPYHYKSPPHQAPLLLPPAQPPYPGFPPVMRAVPAPWMSFRPPHPQYPPYPPHGVVTQQQRPDITTRQQDTQPQAHTSSSEGQTCGKH